MLVIKYGHYKHLTLFINPFTKDKVTLKWRLRVVWLDLQLVYCFFGYNVRFAYRCIFRIKPKPPTPLTKEEQIELRTMFEDMLTNVQKVQAINSHKEIRKRWEDAGLLKKDRR